MIVRQDLKSKYGLDLNKMFKYSSELIEINVEDVKVVFDSDCPETYYIKDISGKWFLVTRKNIFSLIEIGKRYVFTTISNTIIGICEELED